MTQGESNWGQTGSNEVKPAGKSTPARPETAARLGKRPQGTDEAVLGLIGELLQAHVGWWWRPGLWWLEPTTASSKAAAGVRTRTGLMFRCAAGPAGGRDRLLGATQAR